MNHSPDLPPGFAGDLLYPQDPSYEPARMVFNRLRAGRPGVIARCANAADVQAALRLARERGLDIAVRGGGHSIAGWSSLDGGMVIDLSRMRSVHVDPDASTAWIGGGTLAIDLLVEAEKYGLAAVTGVSTTVGLGGLLLGIGEGYLSPKYGYATDNVQEVELVTAAGDILRVSGRSEPELFWAIRGAGANFGVVTAIKVRLHPSPKSAIGGYITFGPDDLVAVNDHMWEVMETGSEHQFPLVFYVIGEDHRPRIAVFPCHTGPEDEAQRDIARLRSCGKALSDTMRPMPYIESILHHPDEPGPPEHNAHRPDNTVNNVWDLFLFDYARVDHKDALLEFQARLPLRTMAIDTWRTVPTPQPEMPNVAARRPGLTVHLSGTWTEPGEQEAHLSWARDTYAAFADLASDVPPNAINHVTYLDTARLRRLYGDTDFERLVDLKTIHDPENFFRSNANIPPRNSRSPR